jgi:hypothetical protein
MLVMLEEIGKVKLIVFLLFIFGSIGIADVDSSSSPPSLLALPAAYFHALIVETAALAES